jgi:hypothetical protein
MYNPMRLGWWTIALLIIFVGVNYGLFFSYQQTDRTEVANLEKKLAITDNLTERALIEGQIALKQDLGSQIWSYCGTEAFKTVSVSILIALILALLGYLFKINDAIAEKVRAERQKRIDTQKDCIKLTSDMWNELYGLVSEVRFYKKDGDNTKKEDSNKENDGDVKDEQDEKRIEDLLIKLENFASQVEDIVNKWAFTFPLLNEIERDSEKELEKDLKNEVKDRIKRLKKEYRKDKNKFKEMRKEERDNYYINLEIYRSTRADESILVFINIMYEAAISVAYYIREWQKGNESIDKDLLQNSLGVIQDVVKDIAHHRIMSIFKLSVDSLREEKSGQHENRSKFQKLLYYLKKDAMIMMQLEKDQNTLLPQIDTGDIAEYRKEAAAFEEWAKTKEHHDASMMEYERYKECDTSYEGIKIPEKDFVGAWEIKYSKEFLLELATYLGNFDLKLYLKNRAQWLKKNKKEKEKETAVT